MKVLFLPEVSQQFVELAEILYDKGYLSFLDDAIEYSDSLFRQIQRELPIRVHRDAPAYFNRYGKGMSYAASLEPWEDKLLTIDEYNAQNAEN